MMVFSLWAAWQSQKQVDDLAPSEIAQVESPDGSIRDFDREAPEPESVPEPTPAGKSDSTAALAGPQVAEPADWSRRFDLGPVELQLSNRGGVIESWVLKQFTAPSPIGEQPIDLVAPEPDQPGAFATPLRELGLGDLSQVRFAVEEVGPRSVAFAHRRAGITVRKAFAIDAETYSLRMTLRVENESGGVVSPRFDVVIPAHVRTGSDFTDQSYAALQEGSVEREKVAGLGVPGFFGGGEPEVSHRGEIEWTGIDNKYFLSALLPDRVRTASTTFRAVEPGKKGLLELEFERVEIPQGHSIEHEIRGYLGPKRSPDLVAVEPALELSINRGYAWLVPLTRFFEWLLAAIYSVIPNYGVAIILLTVLVRLVTAPIMSRQMRSMERMRAVQPLLKEIQEKHKDDRQKQSEAMMEMYRREKINPLGGCLPMLLQFPVFIGLFYALQSSFELRHASFMLWMTDLSAPESLFTLPGVDIPVRVLPLIMGASMVLQQRLTPTTVDPAQARMMMTIMPIMFTVLFYQFPSGLVLYWMISNFLGIAHQLFVGRRMRAS